MKHNILFSTFGNNKGFGIKKLKTKETVETDRFQDTLHFLKVESHQFTTIRPNWLMIFSH